MGKFTEAIKRGMQNGGRKTYGGGDMAELDPYSDKRSDAIRQAGQVRDSKGKLIEKKKK